MSDSTIKLICEIVLGILGVCVPIIVKYITAYIKSKTDNQAIQEAADDVGDVVTQVNQTFVDDLKKDGTFTDEKKTEAFTKALSLAKELITADTQKLITKYKGDFDTWLNTQIETWVSKKKGGATVVAQLKH